MKEEIRREMEMYIKQLESALVFMCDTHEAQQTERLNASKLNTAEEIKNHLIMEMPVIQGTRNGINISRTAKLPCDMELVGTAFKILSDRWLEDWKSKQ